MRGGGWLSNFFKKKPDKPVQPDEPVIENLKQGTIVVFEYPLTDKINPDGTFNLTLSKSFSIKYTDKTFTHKKLPPYIEIKIYQIIFADGSVQSMYERPTVINVETTTGPDEIYKLVSGTTIELPGSSEIIIEKVKYFIYGFVPGPITALKS